MYLYIGRKIQVLLNQVTILLKNLFCNVLGFGFSCDNPQGNWVPLTHWDLSSASAVLFIKKSNQGYINAVKRKITRRVGPERNRNHIILLALYCLLIYKVFAVIFKTLKGPKFLKGCHTLD